MKDSQTTKWITFFWFVVLLSLPFAMSGCGPQVKINLISDKTIYESNEPIKMQIRVYNNRVNIFGQKKPVITNHGFFYQDFHSRIIIFDPNGIPVGKKYSKSAKDPAPPYRREGKFLVPVEIIPPGAENIYFIEDIREYYDLDKAYGWYKAVVHTQLETFSNYEEFPTGEPYAELLSRCSTKSTPLSSNKIRFEIVPPEPHVKLTIKAHVYRPMDGLQQEMYPIENAMVRLYKVSQISNEHQPINREKYTYLWNHYNPKSSRLTHANGIATFSGIEQDDYLILVRRPALTGAVTMGNLIAKDDTQWQSGKVIESYLSVVP